MYMHACTRMMQTFLHAFRFTPSPFLPHSLIDSLPSSLTHSLTHSLPPCLPASLPLLLSLASCQQLVPFEVVCLTLAQCWMWADNLRLALRHWSINDPLMVRALGLIPIHVLFRLKVPSNGLRACTYIRTLPFKRL